MMFQLNPNLPPGPHLPQEKTGSTKTFLFEATLRLQVTSWWISLRTMCQESRAKLL